MSAVNGESVLNLKHRLQQPHGAVAVSLLAAVAVFFLLKWVGWDAEASGAVFAAGGISLVHLAYLIFVSVQPEAHETRPGQKP